MPATLATVEKAVIHLMNENTSGVYDNAISGDRFTIGLIDEAIFESDEDVVLSVLETPGHWSRADYLTLSSALASGDPIPTHIGDIGRVLITPTSGGTFVPAVEAPFEAVLRYRENDSLSYGLLAHTVSGNSLAGYFHITEEHIIYFTGYQAKVWLASYARTAALQSPAVYTNAVVCGAVARLLKEGGSAERAGYFGQMFGSYIQMIRGNAKAVPELAMAA